MKEQIDGNYASHDQKPIAPEEPYINKNNINIKEHKNKQSTIYT
jgi:hypothetical protein